MGSVYLRGKSYIGKYKDENDLWIRKTLGNKNIMTKTMAREIVKEYERKVKLGQHEIIKAKIPTLKAFSGNYLSYVKNTIQKRSWSRDQLCLKHLLGFFGNRKLDKIHPKDIDDYKDCRQTKVKPATVNRELEVLRHLYNLAERWNHFFGKNPVSISGLLKTNNLKQRILKPEEELRLLGASPTHLKNIIICALNTGMRKGEIISLTWSNVDFENNFLTIDVTNSKSKKERKIPINSTLRKLLLALKLKCGDREYVFLNSNGEPYKRQDSLNNVFRLARKKAEVEDLRFHDLRHTAGTRMVEANINIVAVKEILGHSSLEMTLRYAHPHDSLLDAVEALSTNFSDSHGHKSGHIST